MYWKCKIASFVAEIAEKSLEIIAERSRRLVKARNNKSRSVSAFPKSQCLLDAKFWVGSTTDPIYWGPELW